MTSSFQHRLVGTIILVAVGIIFLPDLLDGQKVAYRENTASIPLRPSLTAVAEPVDFDSLDAAVAEADAQLLAEPADTVDLTPAVKPKLAPIAKTQTRVTTPTVGDSWNIRLGSFKNSAAVDDLVTKLRKAGYDAYRLPRHPQVGQLNRLYVGPNVSRDKLQTMLPKLEKITGLKGVIKKFDARDK